MKIAVFCLGFHLNKKKIYVFFSRIIGEKRARWGIFFKDIYSASNTLIFFLHLLFLLFAHPLWCLWLFVVVVFFLFWTDRLCDDWNYYLQPEPTASLWLWFVPYFDCGFYDDWWFWWYVWSFQLCQPLCSTARQIFSTAPGKAFFIAVTS